jgi:1-acyl-sn-glycerol-3-phosphate acyltransferase
MMSRRPDALVVPPDVLAELPSRARRLVRWSAAMQTGAPARALHAWRRAVGARAVLALLREPPRVDGWAHVAAVDPSRPLLLLANHRSYVDFFVVAAVLLRRLPWITAVNFPVKGAYCYEGWPGALLNAAAAGFAAFPPFFRRSETARADAWALDTLVGWCRHGGGRVVGFHPEGTRHQSDDPWSLLPAQPGVGRLLLEAEAQALPVFIAGLANSWQGQRRLRDAGTPVRLRFGAPVDLSPWATAPRRLRTYVAVGGAVMARLQRLADDDRAAWGEGQQKNE